MNSIFEKPIFSFHNEKTEVFFLILMFTFNIFQLKKKKQEKKKG